MNSDVCIVGGGAAGVTLSRELERFGVTTTLVEAGAGSNDLYKGFVDPPSTHRQLHLDRFRGLGGSTSHWGGRCIPFDLIDFEDRNWVEHSGWPISHAEIDAHHQTAASYCEIGNYQFESNTGLIPEFVHPNICANTLERWSPPTHFGKRWCKDLNVVDGVVTRIYDGEVELANGDSIRANHIVLAGGGLETTRLLLHSNLGNHSDWLGRGYMTHRYGWIARVHFSSATNAGYERDADGVPIRRRFRFSEKAQRDLQLLNGYFVVDRPPIEDPGHKSSILSLGYFAKRLLGKHIDANAGPVSQHLRNLVADSPALLSTLPKFVVERYFKQYRIPSLLPPSTAKLGYLFYHHEQVPHRDSRITLADAKDRLGVPQLKVDYRVQEQDVETVVRQHKLLDEALRETGTGRLEYLVDSPADAVREAEAMYAHHIGATRMSADPADGVVDENCRVHGTDNVYVASASVFPTSGAANPTLTLLALTCRLAQHLAE